MDLVILEKIESSILNGLGYIGCLEKKNGSKNKDKKSILGQIKSFKTDDKSKSNKKNYSKGAER